MVLPEDPVVTPISIAGRSTRRGRDGFTLFELVIVVAILAIMTGLAVPYLRMDTGDTVKKAGDFLQLTMDKGRNLARLKRRSVTIQFGTTGISLSGEQLEEMTYPDSVGFRGLVLVGDERPAGNTLEIDHRGVVPVSMVRMNVDGDVYSFLLSPVLRDVMYQKGMADFSDFSD